MNICEVQKRTLQYRPDGDEFVCVNGKNRYTRALYGSHSPFRVETSDRPVFAFYNNGRGGNISFKVILRDGTELALDCTGHCESRYSAGKRTYYLTDPSWGKGELRISVLALAIWMELFGVFLLRICLKELYFVGNMGELPENV